MTEPGTSATASCRELSCVTRVDVTFERVFPREPLVTLLARERFETEV